MPTALTNRVNPLSNVEKYCCIPGIEYWDKVEQIGSEAVEEETSEDPQGNKVPL